MPAVKLSPIFQDEQLDNNGLPLAGGLLSWFLAGTSTPVTVYADSGGVSAQTQPIVLNTRGEPPNPIWLPTGANYKATLTDSLSTLIRTVDNIPPINDFTSPSLSEWSLFGGAVTYQDATHFTTSGDQTAIFTTGRRLQLTVGGSYQYATIVTSVFATGTTTVTVLNDISSITSGLTQAFYGILNSVNPSLPTVTKAPISITAAATTALGAINSNTAIMSGTTTITAFDVSPNGMIKVVIWNAATPITYNSTSMQLIGLASRVNNVGDISVFESGGTGNWKELAYQQVAGNAPTGTIIQTLASVPPPGYLALPTSSATISRTTYANLFAVIGTMFGAGDGSTTFGIPYVSADFALLHNPASIGSQTSGAVISHNHATADHNHVFNNVASGGATLAAGAGYNLQAGTTNAANVTVYATGGANNLASGLRTLFCVKY